MKLNKLTSAVSISLAALVLTACGNDNNTPNTSSQNIVNDSQAKIDADLKAQQEKLEAEIKAKIDAELKAQREKLEAEKKKELDALQEENKKLKEKVDAKNDPNAIFTENKHIEGFDKTKVSSVGAGNYIRSDASTFDLPSNPDRKKYGSNNAQYEEELVDNELSNYVVGAETFKFGNDKHTYKYVLGATEAKIGAERLYNYAETDDEENSIQANNSVRIGDFNENRSNDDVELVKSVYYLLGKTGEKFMTKEEQENLDDNSSKKPLGQDGRPDLEDSGLIVRSNSVNRGSNTNEAFGLPELLLVTKKDHAQSDSVVNKKSVRVFGAGFNEDDLTTDISNSYQATPNATDPTKFGNLTEIKLANVQYGRLTGQLNGLTDIPETQRNKEYVSRAFAERALDTVDTYFYRGLNNTTIDQMAKVKAKNVDLVYRGHALVYGDQDKAGSNAVGRPQSFGNFVEAVYKPATDKVSGSIYNFRVGNNVAKPSDITKQDLITFNGDVSGNTVAGVALKDGDTGTFKASFFGQNAEELGGSISSLNTTDSYGANKWGAVFGAQRSTVVEIGQGVQNYQ